MTKNSHLSDLERLSIRERPEGLPLMHQTWGKLLFMHWRMDEKLLRPLIPDELEIDTFDGTAWIGITPFTMWDIRGFPPYMPSIPGLSSLNELNVRTYVHYDRVPGVWFFSLDCDSKTAVLAARNLFLLPYYEADIELEEDENTIDYALDRDDEPEASFTASWDVGETIPFTHPGSLEFFLTERYCLYTEDERRLYRARIYHEPWPLQKATLNSLDSTMIEAMDLPTPKGEPLLHYCEELSVDIWPLKKV
jgi:uncharacterized protein